MISKARFFRRFCAIATDNAKIIDKDGPELSRILWDTFLKLEKTDTLKFRSVNLLKGRRSHPWIYGGQVFAHSLKAACETVSPDLPPHSIHSYFIKAGSVYDAVDYVVEKTRDGGSFCTRRVQAFQKDELLFSAQISFHKREPTAIGHEPQLITIPNGPDGLATARKLMKDCVKSDSDDVALTSKLFAQYKLAEFPPTFHRIFEARPVNPQIYSLKIQDQLHKPEFTMWIRPTIPIGDNFYLQRLFAAYLSDASMVETAIIPHLAQGFIPGMIFSLDHCVWFHKADFNMDNWMILEQISDHASAGRTFTRSRLFTKNGELVLSACQEGLARALRQ